MNHAFGKDHFQVLREISLSGISLSKKEILTNSGGGLTRSRLDMILKDLYRNGLATVLEGVLYKSSLAGDMVAGLRPLTDEVKAKIKERGIAIPKREPEYCVEKPSEAPTVNQAPLNEPERPASPSEQKLSQVKKKTSPTEKPSVPSVVKLNKKPRKGIEIKDEVLMTLSDVKNLKDVFFDKREQDALALVLEGKSHLGFTVGSFRDGFKCLVARGYCEAKHGQKGFVFTKQGQVELGLKEGEAHLPNTSAFFLTRIQRIMLENTRVHPRRTATIGGLIKHLSDCGVDLTQAEVKSNIKALKEKGLLELNPGNNMHILRPVNIERLKNKEYPPAKSAAEVLEPEIPTKDTGDRSAMVFEGLDSSSHPEETAGHPIVNREVQGESDITRESKESKLKDSKDKNEQRSTPSVKSAMQELNTLKVRLSDENKPELIPEKIEFIDALISVHQGNETTVWFLESIKSDFEKLLKE